MRYRASIYVDIFAESKEEAEEKAKKLVEFLSDEDSGAPDYFSLYLGGVATIEELISGKEI